MEVKWIPLITGVMSAIYDCLVHSSGRWWGHGPFSSMVRAVRYITISSYH